LFEGQWKLLGERFPGDPIVNYNAGLWMMDIRNYKEAIVRLRAATESPRLPEALRGAAFEHLGLALLGGGQVAEAESSLLTSLKQPQPNLRIHCLLAMVYKQTGRLEEAGRAGTECLNAPDREKTQ
jgi:Tfp pilus assembly protein PilF